MRTLAVGLAVSLALLTQADAASYRRTVTIADAVGEAESSFGTSIAGSPAGRLLVGAPVDSAGSAQLFDAVTGALVYTIPGPALSYLFGSSVAAAGDDLLIGDPSYLLGDPSTGGAFVGAVHRFDAATGAPEDVILSPTPSEGTSFGRVVALRGSEVLVIEQGFVHRYDAASGVFLGSIAAPPGSSPAFGTAVLGLGALVVVGDPDANRVYVFDAMSGALLRTIAHPVAGENASFGRSLATLDGDLLVGALGASGGTGAAYRIHLPSGRVRTIYRNPAPSTGDSFGFEVGTFGDAVVVGAPGDDLMEEGLRDGAAHVFDADSGRLVAILGRASSDYLDFFGARIGQIGDQVFVSAPHEDVNTVTGFRLDCGDAPTCEADDARLTRTRARLGPGTASVRTHLRLTDAEMAALAAGFGTLCILGPPNYVVCESFPCTGDDRRLTCPIGLLGSTGEVTLTRRGRDSGLLVASIMNIAGAPTTTGPIAVRFNGGGETTRAAGLRRCRGRGANLACR